MSTVPDKIGKYEVMEEVGRGSMGTVYSAHDPFSSRMLALKVAHPQFVNDDTHAGERFRKLFFNEAHAAGVLEHPNILRVYDIWYRWNYIIYRIVGLADTAIYPP